MKTDCIIAGDCLDVLLGLPAGSVDLAFADPPFNIELPYPDHDDDMPEEVFLAWLSERFAAVRRVLSPTGSLFVAIGQQVQAEVLVMLKKQLGFHWRNTIPWHYHFGPCQSRKFTPSWTPIHYLVMDSRRFTFNADAVRVPSERQRRYADRRAAASGKTPNDVWVLHPDDDSRFFAPEGDTWHARRECGTFAGRTDYPCQMPLPILERIVAVASNSGQLVLDPFCGTGTTLVTAKQLGRHWLGVDKSEEAAGIARQRLEAVTNPLPGLEES